MNEKEERFLMALAVIALIVALMAITIKVINRTGINGETIEVEAIEIEEVLPTETSVACTATPIVDTPIYIQSISFECVEDLEDETEYPTRDEVYCLARTVHGEASICSDLVKSKVAWVVLNRVDSEDFPNTIREVVEEDKQFQGYYRERDIIFTTEEWEMCYQIVFAWKNYDDRYRSLPSDYYYFRGDGQSNYFTQTFCNTLKEAKQKDYKGTMPNLWKGEENDDRKT